MPDEKRSSNAFRDSFAEAGPYLTLGLELGFTMIVWSALGYLADRWLDTTPWLTLVGVLIGMVSLFIQLVRASKRSLGKKDGAKRDRG